MVNDLGAAVSGALVVLGDGLGIYTALAESGPVTSEELAEKTNLNERQLREWLSAQAASGYVSYDATSRSSRKVSGLDRAFPGESITPACFAVRSGFSDPAISPTSTLIGYQRLTASSKN